MLTRLWARVVCAWKGCDMKIDWGEYRYKNHELPPMVCLRCGRVYRP